jgi:glycosyltransferase involved in cell wall biosynthesis
LVREVEPLPARKPRLLFLAYFFPPAKVMASVRSSNIAKWLTRYGWEVTVVTPRGSVWRRFEDDTEAERELAQGGSRCLRTPYRWRFLTPWYTAASFEKGRWLTTRVAGRLAAWARGAAGWLKIPLEIGWVLEAEKACAQLSSDEVDLVLATGTPFASFALARRVARRLRRPYVLDYRDLCSDYPYPERRPRQLKLETERKVLSECTAATVVSPSMVRVIASRFKLGSKLHLISNGYDAEALSKVPPHAFGHFGIVYAGSFHPPIRVATPVMAALARLKERGSAPKEWAFHYYGPHTAHVREAAEKFGLEDRVVLHGIVSRQEALSAVRGAGMAVVIASVASTGSPAVKGVLTGKIFEAIGLKTPLWVIAPAGSDLEEVLRVAGRGRRFSGDEIEAMASYLEDAMAGRTPPPGRSEVFDWARIGADLDRLLRGVLDGASSRLT